MKLYKVIAFGAALTAAGAASAADLGRTNYGGSTKDEVVYEAPATNVRWTSVYVGAGIGIANTENNFRGERRDYDRQTYGTAGNYYQGEPVTVYTDTEGQDCTDEPTDACHVVGDPVPEGSTYAGVKTFRHNDPLSADEAGYSGLEGGVTEHAADDFRNDVKDNYLYSSTSQLGLLNLGADDSSSIIGSIHIGADYQASRFVFGVLADYDFRGGVSARFSSGRDIDQSGAWFLGGRAGVLATPNTLIYGLFGYTWLNYDNIDQYGDLKLITGAYGVDPKGRTYSYNDDSIGMWTVGLGVESFVTQHVSLGLEGRYSWGEDRRFYGEYLADSAGNLAASRELYMEPEDWTIKAKISYHFGN